MDEACAVKPETGALLERNILRATKWPILTRGFPGHKVLRKVQDAAQTISDTQQQKTGEALPRIYYISKEQDNWLGESAVGWQEDPTRDKWPSRRRAI